MKNFWVFQICESSSGVEHHLAKVEVAGSNPVFRSKSVLKKIFIIPMMCRGHNRSSGGIGRHVGLKIQWVVMPVRVQVPSRVQRGYLEIGSLFFIKIFLYLLMIAISCILRHKKNRL
ncbi:hypothetical protein BBFL7_01344 [Flavobacteria bacterium BBFL7]|nr:hypothetical protein BBFL7_01344 [Flavobacteria bacterium BBFL7]